METIETQSIELEQLERQIVVLLETYHRLQQENKLLQEQRNLLEQEQRKLREKNHSASEKIQSMINRLKAIEAAS